MSKSLRRRRSLPGPGRAGKPFCAVPTTRATAHPVRRRHRSGCGTALPPVSSASRNLLPRRTPATPCRPGRLLHPPAVSRALPRLPASRAPPGAMRPSRSTRRRPPLITRRRRLQTARRHLPPPRSPPKMHPRRRQPPVLPILRRPFFGPPLRPFLRPLLRPLLGPFLRPLLHSFCRRPNRQNASRPLQTAPPTLFRQEGLRQRATIRRFFRPPFQGTLHSPFYSQFQRPSWQAPTRRLKIGARGAVPSGQRRATHRRFPRPCRCRCRLPWRLPNQCRGGQRASHQHRRGRSTPVRN